MHISATVLAPAHGLSSERESLVSRSHPLRTATGFVVGTALSSAMWVVAGVFAWYLI